MSQRYSTYPSLCQCTCRQPQPDRFSIQRCLFATMLIFVDLFVYLKLCMYDHSQEFLNQESLETYSALSVIKQLNPMSVHSIIVVGFNLMLAHVCDKFEVKRIDVLLVIHQILVIIFSKSFNLNPLVPLALVLYDTFFCIKSAMHVQLLHHR